MRGAVLIVGGSKQDRLELAWKELAKYGFAQAKKASATAQPDLLLVQKEKDRKSLGIAQAREVKTFLRERPLIAAVKAVLIEDAQQLTAEAQNSLLKILEEPPDFGLILLLVDKEGSLLPTVLSRCQVLVLKVKDKPSGQTSYELAVLAPEELFELARTLSAQGKEEALEFLEHVLQADIAVGRSPILVSKTVQAIKELRTANVALKFALEYLFLRHCDSI
ncbi:hypothetical protein KKG63_02400 [Patescibacteria group bacterium]|nr:hypothetical protein [Patescibacteria group bacterium]